MNKTRKQRIKEAVIEGVTETRVEKINQFEESNKFSIASTPVAKRYPKLEDCSKILTTFNLNGLHYVIYLKESYDKKDI